MVAVKKTYFVLLGWLLVTTLGWVGCSTSQETPFPAVTRMSIEELRATLSDTSTVVIDVRTAKPWEKSDLKIKGARRENPKKEVGEWSNKYPKNKTYVLYCS